MNPLNHVAIIMDGNGRWGLKKNNSRNAGHRKGLETVQKVIEDEDLLENANANRQDSKKIYEVIKTITGNKSFKKTIYPT